ncbi:MAG: hypothetical protein LBR36_06960 [Bacteroidales bacterium]|jgi:outer membrane protein OmpA-like peptidoglycan-associated protein|nr:hypothetical protein [Bacteroidales bacterium]
MKNRKFAAILLFAATMNGFAQQTYTDFDVSSLQVKEEYNRNFNPLEYDPDILDACVLSVVNLARMKYNFADPLFLSDTLSNAARFQSEFMAKKEEKTSENVVASQKTAPMRSVAAGGSKIVNELITRAKATKGNEVYTYLDLSYEIVLSLLKNKKTETILLDKQFTCMGIGNNVDAYNKNVYTSLVLGNDLSFQKGDITYKNTTYTRKSYGLKPYDEKSCKKCNVRGVELMQQYVIVRGFDIYFEHPNVKDLRKLIGKNKDGIAIDIVQHSQFPCNGANDVNHNYYNRGIMPKWFKYSKLIKKNENKDPKDKSVKVFLTSVPATVSGAFDVNLILIKDKHVCRTLVKTVVEQPSLNYSGKTGLVPDLTAIKTTINYVPVAEKATLEFKVPFDQSKYVYEASDIQPFIDALKESRFVIDTIKITSYTSLEGSEQTNLELQKKRAESIVNAMKTIQNKGNIPYSLYQNDSWDLFVKDVANTPYKEYATQSKESVKQALNNSRTRKNLEPILSKHRFAHIVMQVTYDVSEQYQQEFVTNKFNRTFAAGDLPLAFAIEKYMIKQVEDGKFTNRQLIENLVIPENAKNLPFLTNKYYMLSLFSGGLSENENDKVISFAGLDKRNQIADFNAVSASIVNQEITSSKDITTTQNKINSAYRSQVGSAYPNKVNTVNVAFQYKVLDYLNSNDIQDQTQKDATYDIIREIALPTVDNWQKAYEVAATFMNYGDFAFARTILDPYIENPAISEDYIFTYLNLYSYDIESIMSGKFVKACKLASQKNRTRFCEQIRKYSVIAREHLAVKDIICAECQK